MESKLTGNGIIYQCTLSARCLLKKWQTYIGNTLESASGARIMLRTKAVNWLIKHGYREPTEDHEFEEETLETNEDDNLMYELYQEVQRTKKLYLIIGLLAGAFGGIIFIVTLALLTTSQEQEMKILILFIGTKKEVEQKLNQENET